MRPIHHSIRELAVLQEATDMILSSMELEAVLHHILLIARNYFGIAHSAVWLLDESTQELYSRAYNGFEGVDEHLRLRVGKDGIVGHAAAAKSPLFVPDVKQDPRYIGTIPSIHCEYALPLVVREKVVGVLNLESEDPDTFTDDAIGLLALFAGQAAVALENARLYNSERRRMRQIEIINLIARAATTATDMDQLSLSLAELINDSFEGSDVYILLRGPEGALELRAHIGLSLDAGLDTQELLRSSIVQQAQNARMNVVANDASTRNDWKPAIPGAPGSELCIPLISFHESLGLLLIVHQQQQYFSPDDRSLAQAAADVCATAIRNVQLSEELRRVTNTDSLTGVYNQRYFHVVLGQEVARARRYGKQFTLGLLDLRNFRTLNQTFGYSTGDMALRQVAQLLKRQLRSVDTVCRYSGDQFAFILPETAPEKALLVIDKLIDNVRGIAYSDDGKVPPLDGYAVMVGYPQESTAELELVRLLLQRLAAAKSDGTTNRPRS